MTRGNCLLIGATGQVGQAIFASLGRVSDVSITQRESPLETRYYFDAADSNPPKWISDFDTIVYCAGITSFRKCENEVKRSSLVNYATPTRIARLSAANGQRFIFFSTNAAAEYEGLQPLAASSAHRRGDQGASRYGLLFYLAEREVLQTDTAVVIRISKLAVRSWLFINETISRLKAGLPVVALNDHYVSPVEPIVLSDLVGSLIGAEASGMFQLSASNQMSYAEVVRTLATALRSNSKIDVRPAQEVLSDKRFVISKAQLDTTRSELILGRSFADCMSVVGSYL